MKLEPKAKQKQVLPRLKVYLLQGKTITGLQALKRFGTMRLAEYIRVLRHEHGMKIEKKMVEENGKHFAEYWMPKIKKESRVVNRAYIHH